MQDLWKVYYEILSVIFLKEFIKLKVDSDMMMKNVRFAELNISIANVSLNTQILKML